MAKALVQSVGTGTRPDHDIAQPLIWYWKKSGASYTVWIVSRESRRQADRMTEALGLSPDVYDIRETPNENDVEATYRICRAALRDLGRRGFAPEVIEVDYTSGTKAMTAGLVLAAVAHGCGTLSYITGARAHGTVLSGTEQQVPIEPRRIWADWQLVLATELCRVQRFDSAQHILKALHPAWLGDEERQLRDGLLAVAYGYGAWDRFDYARAVGELEKVLEARARELDSFRPAPEVRDRLLALKPERGISPDRLADLFNNAKRRFDEGRYDDALARLYRLTEMLAQWILLRDYGLDTANVDLARVPESLRTELAALRNRHGAVQIGLEWDYRVLEALGHPLGRQFAQGDLPGLDVLLKKRNVSLLAHGLEPIAKDVVESLLTKVRSLVTQVTPDFDARCESLEFPWRRLPRG